MSGYIANCGACLVIPLTNKGIKSVVSTIDVLEWGNALQDRSHKKNSTYSHLLVVDIRMQKFTTFS